MSKYRLNLQNKNGFSREQQKIVFNMHKFDEIVGKTNNILMSIPQ